MRRRSVRKDWWSVWRARRLAEMSSRTAAWGQPPVSMAVMRGAGRAAWRVRNSASSLWGWLVSGEEIGFGGIVGR